MQEVLPAVEPPGDSNANAAHTNAEATVAFDRCYMQDILSPSLTTLICQLTCFKTNNGIQSTTESTLHFKVQYMI